MSKPQQWPPPRSKRNALYYDRKEGPGPYGYPVADPRPRTPTMLVALGTAAMFVITWLFRRRK